MDKLYKDKWLVWGKDPVLFVREALRVDCIEDWQCESLERLVSGDRLAIRSGHGIGKTAFMSWVIIWYLIMHNDVKIPCTANTAKQLNMVLWLELRKWIKRLPLELRDVIQWRSETITVDGVENIAVAITSRKENSESFAGFHATNILFIFDEASGVEEIIFEVAFGALSTDGAKMLLCGNPTKRTGFFAKLFRERSKRWWLRTISCYESGRVSSDWIEEMKDQYGEGSDEFRVRVLGLPPRSDQEALIAGELVDAARRCNEVGNQEHMPIIIGVDPSYGGDRTTLVLRQGRVVRKLEEFKPSNRELHLMELVSSIVRWIRKLRPIMVNIDIGGVGAGVGDRLYELGYGNIVNKINFGHSAINKERYRNKRAEMWGELSEWLGDKPCQLPDCDEIENDLVNVQAGFNDKLQLVLESKSAMKTRGVPSPDWGDAIALTFALPVRLTNEEEYNNIQDSGGGTSATYIGYEPVM